MSAHSPRERMLSRLIAAAERLLAGGVPFPEITVSRLVKEAGVTRSRFYVHFKDKGDVLSAWFETIRRDLVDVDDAWWGIRAGSTESDLATALRSITLAYHPHNLMMAAMYDQSAIDANTRGEIDEIERHRIARLEAHIIEGQAGGWIDPVLMPAETAAWLTYTGARGYQQMVEGEGASIDEFVERYARQIWLVLYEQAPSRAESRRG